MPYSSGGRLPGEAASKLGHLAVVESDWVRSLVGEFETAKPADSDASNTKWTEIDISTETPLRNIWAVDGSFVEIKTQESPPREVAFVKTALMAVDRSRLDAIDKEHPHPLLLRDVLADSAVFHATVFPLKNIRTSMGTNYDAVRHIVYDSMRIDQEGLFFETLKWIAYRKWTGEKSNSPSFACPHCHSDVSNGLPFDSEVGTCQTSGCGKAIFLTDMIGFHLDMDEESAPESVSSAYMAVMEHLMIFTAVRLLWSHSDKNLISDTLFIKDGPLTLRAQYSKLVPNIRSFLQFAKDAGRSVHIIGQEKSGAFVDHLHTVAKFAPPFERGGKPNIAVLTHDYIRREVHRSPDLSNPYGKRTNWGEKLLLKLDPACTMVLNVPTGDYNSDPQAPMPDDLIGLRRILATIPSLVSHRFEGALFPVELANGVASMSSYPSARILQRFIEEAPRR